MGNLKQSELQPLGKTIEVYNPSNKIEDFERLEIKLVEVSNLIRIDKVRKKYGLLGENQIAGVVDTGVFKEHEDFGGRIIAEFDVSSFDGSVLNSAPDEDGHGTHVSGIIAANSLNIGIAPKSNLVCIRALRSRHFGLLFNVNIALEQIIKYNESTNQKVTAVNLSLGDTMNYDSDFNRTYSIIYRNILKLYGMNIPVIIAAGNLFYPFDSTIGVSFPAICRHAIAVGSVFDADFNREMNYPSGARITNPRKGEITPYTQRLLRRNYSNRPTYLLAPGSQTISTGITPGSSTMLEGSSQATAVVTGLVLLIQEFYKSKMKTSDLPTVDQVAGWLLRGGVTVCDKINRSDNVRNTGICFRRIDALKTINLIDKELNF